MRKNTSVRLLLAIACFAFAGLELYQLLQGPGNYAWEDLFSIFIFSAMGLLYVYIILRQRDEPSS